MEADVELKERLWKQMWNSRRAQLLLMAGQAPLGQGWGLLTSPTQMLPLPGSQNAKQARGARNKQKNPSELY